MPKNNNLDRIKAGASALGAACTIFGATLLLLLAGHYALGAADAMKDWLQGKENINRADMFAAHRLPVYDDMPEAEAFWREHLQAWDKHFEPYIHYRRDAFSGKWTNVSDEGLRKTIKSPAEGAKKVFMFGGSTLWGSGATDAQTIPSQLQKLLGPDYDVYNFGESGFVSTQELNYLLLRLAKGDRPDIVIFYDGANDTYTGAYSPAVPRDPHELRQHWKTESNQPAWPVRLLLESNYGRLARRLGQAGSGSDSAWDTQIEKHIEQNAGLIMALYNAHIRQVRALAREYGFKAYFFWQPIVFAGEKPLLPYEQTFVDDASSTWVKASRVVYAKAAVTLNGREKQGVFNISDAFADTREPLYWDWCHLGARGNALIAKRMHSLIFDNSGQ